ncbi:hypothetical protein JRO89_XS06G0070200 [Xanthoceras sorbifolium]|uniref:Uncharacterized protein n=1 Tax=Xanthoceras sorbifolium TaxID=99658 RepID=A0ABQ8HX14_9ROSI|nr:hypothetical protein JRO89_XS06G0070200 [Xanthoceras sorbifolium]
MILRHCRSNVLEPRMSCSIAYVNTGSRPWLIVLAFISFFFILSCGDEAGDSYKLTNIGAIIDVNSRVGKEEKVAMQIAVQDFNNAYQNHKLSLHFQDRERDPLRAASAAEKLVKEKKVKGHYRHEDGESNHNDENGGDTGDLTLFSEALQDIGSEIEYRLVLPPFSYLTNPKEVVQEELKKLLIEYSLAFLSFFSHHHLWCSAV